MILRPLSADSLTAPAAPRWQESNNSLRAQEAALEAAALELQAEKDATRAAAVADQAFLVAEQERLQAREVAEAERAVAEATAEKERLQTITPIDDSSSDEDEHLNPDVLPSRGASRGASPPPGGRLTPTRGPAVASRVDRARKKKALAQAQAEKDATRQELERFQREAQVREAMLQAAVSKKENDRLALELELRARAAELERKEAALSEAQAQAAEAQQQALAVVETGEVAHARGAAGTADGAGAVALHPVGAGSAVLPTEVGELQQLLEQEQQSRKRAEARAEESAQREEDALAAMERLESEMEAERALHRVGRVALEAEAKAGAEAAAVAEASKLEALRRCEELQSTQLEKANAELKKVKEQYTRFRVARGESEDSKGCAPVGATGVCSGQWERAVGAGGFSAVTPTHPAPPVSPHPFQHLRIPTSRLVAVARCSPNSSRGGCRTRWMRLRTSSARSCSRWSLLSCARWSSMQTARPQLSARGALPTKRSRWRYSRRRARGRRHRRDWPPPTVPRSRSSRSADIRKIAEYRRRPAASGGRTVLALQTTRRRARRWRRAR